MASRCAGRFSLSCLLGIWDAGGAWGGRMVEGRGVGGWGGFLLE